MQTRHPPQSPNWRKTLKIKRLAAASQREKRLSTEASPENRTSGLQWFQSRWQNPQKVVYNDPYKEYLGVYPNTRAQWMMMVRLQALFKTSDHCLLTALQVIGQTQATWMDTECR